VPVQVGLVVEADGGRGVRGRLPRQQPGAGGRDPLYMPMFRQPVLVLTGDEAVLTAAHERAGGPYAGLMTATRLLVLGVVRGYGRAHGYLIGSTLASWDAESWASVKWGSIYHALRTMTATGLLADHDDVPGRTDYALTPRGDAEYLRLLRTAVRRPHARPDQLAAALAMLPSLTRSEALELLRERLTALEEIRDKARGQLGDEDQRPHWHELYGLWERTADCGIDWTGGLIERLAAGAYAMAGEPRSPGPPGSWTALADGNR
jgi:DNA-binding PadR family transcriptional regulator